MSQKKETTPKKKTANKKGAVRNAKGQFVKGNIIGEETRFQKDNAAACKFKEEYCDRIIEFFSQPAQKTEYKEIYFKGELTSRVPIVVATEYPTFELFAASLGVTTETVKNWTEISPRFKSCYARAKEMQLGKLTANAIAGLYNPVYAKFEAVNNHGKADKQEVETNVVGGLDEKTLAMIQRVGERLNGKKEDE